MEISEQDLRDRVRDAIARHLGLTTGGPGSADAEPGHRSAVCAHVSHGLLILPPQPADRCVIEPAVRCDHCGHCKSLGY